MTVTEMDERSLSDDLFEVPEGYTEMTDQMKQMMGMK